MQITIKFKDAQNWQSITGNVTRWDDYYKLIKHDRIYNDYVQPEVVTDSWNGQEFDVQHSRWNAYRLEFIVKEGEIQEFEKIRSASDIVIQDNINAITHYPDTTLSSYFEVSEPEQIENTPDFRYTIKYRTHRTYINKQSNPQSIRGISIANDGTIDNKWADIIASNEIEGIVYRTDFEFITDNNDVERNTIDDGDGVPLPVKGVSNITGRMLFFLNEAQATQLKRYGEIVNIQRFLLDSYTDFVYGTSKEDSDSNIFSAAILEVGMYIKVDIEGTIYTRYITAKTGGDTYNINEAIPFPDSTTTYDTAIQEYYDIQNGLTVNKELIAYNLYRCELTGIIQSSINYPQA